MKNYLAKNVDEYIAHTPKEAQSKLREIRAVIKSSVPKAEEGISWGIPFYKYHSLLSGFAAFKNHVTFGLVAGTHFFGHFFFNFNLWRIGRKIGLAACLRPYEFSDGCNNIPGDKWPHTSGSRFQNDRVIPALA